MPTTPASADRRSAHPRRNAPVDEVDGAGTRPLSLRKADIVQDRIREWQEQAAANAVALETASLDVASRPRSELSCHSTRIQTPEPAPEEPNDIHAKTSPLGRSTGRWADVDQREWIRKGRASTPRKRVISDEHWRIKPNAKQGAPPALRERRPIEKAFLEAVLPKQDIDRTISKARAEREERRQRRKDARSKRAGANKEEDVDTDIFRGPGKPESQPQLQRKMPVSRLSQSHDDCHEDNTAAFPISQVSDQQDQSCDWQSNIQLDEEDNRSYRQGRYTAVLGQQPQYALDKPPRLRKGSIMNKTKEIIGFSEPPRTLSIRLPSIEAWLDDQPDPFTERGLSTGDGLNMLSQNVAAKPTKTRSKRRPVSMGVSSSDPNKIWDSVSDRTIQQNYPEPVTATSKQRPSSPEHTPTSLSPISLQRRGAKSSRPKRHTVSHSLLDTDSTPLILPVTKQSSTSLTAQYDDRQPLQEAISMSLSTNIPTETSLCHSLPPLELQNSGTGSHGLKCEITTSERLMSELSRPMSSKRLRKSRSTKTMCQQPDEDAIRKILDSLKDDEAKYSRELRTLVDGVIPVLLQSVLSKSDSVAMDLFSVPSDKDTGLNSTKPIIDMGISLERLKSLHNRIQLQSIEGLLAWCQTAHKAYSGYLNAWRLGFQDVIVNLAPLAGAQEDNNDIMDRDENGDVIGNDGEKVDVAFLLKRPLVKIRKISKLLCCLREQLVDNPVAAKLAEDFIDLMAQAKRKHAQEQGRLEDEAASHVDATKVRDICTLKPMANVTVDKGRNVRARDCFDMTLHHSTGQRMDCKVEMILRDNRSDLPSGGDVLICGIDADGRFLLFAPMDITHVSARKGETGHDLVVMIRGRTDLRSEWRELLALKAEVPEAAAEWLNMLGSNPLPPGLHRVPTFLEKKTKADRSIGNDVPESLGDTSVISDVDVLDIPIGEPSEISRPQARPNPNEPRSGRHSGVKQMPTLSLGGGLQPKAISEQWHAQSSILSQRYAASSVPSSDRSTISGRSTEPKSQVSRSSMSSHSTPLTHRLAQGERQGASLKVQLPLCSPQTPITQPGSVTPKQIWVTQDLSQAAPAASPSGDLKKVRYDSEPLLPQTPTPLRQREHRSGISSDPSQDSIKVSKSRSAQTAVSALSTPLTDSIRDTWAALTGQNQKASATSITFSPQRERLQDSPSDRGSQPSYGCQPSDITSTSDISATESRRSVILEHEQKRVPRPQPRSSPRVKPIDVRSSGLGRHSRTLSSSPLKHEYAPSTSSDTADESDSNSSEDGSTSDTSDDLDSELKDEVKPLPDVSFAQRRTSRGFAQQSAPPSTKTHTLAPSDSASQGPYRHVPPSSTWPADKKKRAIAMVCSWSDTTMWQPLQEDECSIVVSPGLIEVFPMSSMQTSASQLSDEQPLVAFELTPIVQLRQGTAVDITIRSPPTANSRIKSSNNTMFRSRTVMASDELYRMLHWARCNNPTYIELERSRPRPQLAVTFNTQPSERPRSWFSFGNGLQRRNTYRAGSMPPPSIQHSTASSGSMSNAMSALKRFSKSSSFSINRSSVIRRPGFGTRQSLYSSCADTTTGSGSSTPAPPTQIGHIPGKEGPSVPETSAAAVEGAGMINNMKIKLFVRTGQDWRPMGSSRLSVLPAPVSSPETSRPASPITTPPAATTPSRRTSAIAGNSSGQRREYRLPSSSHTPHRVHGNGREKRVVITMNKRPDLVLLDEVLGESSFEKIAERGVAMNVWKEAEEITHRGGVMTGRGTKYLMQFEGASEASWVFGLCGSYRYGFHET